MSSTGNSVDPTHSLETDVLIVGGGPVGLFTAYRLGIIYERLLKSAVDELHNVKSFWGYNFESIEEIKDAVYSTIHDPNGKPIVVKSKYTIGCDGAGSRVRSLVGINAPREGINPEEFINKQLGGWGKPFNIKVSEVGVISKWEATVALADSFRSSKGRVFLSGDSAHRLTPAGGHGLNSGIHDVFDLTWKLAANIHGWGGETLLESYNKERRSAAELNIKMVWKAMTEIMLPRFTSTEESGRERLIANSEEGQMARSLLQERIMRGEWIHRQLGTTLGHRYKDTPVIIADTSSMEPRESITEYVPSTWPGVKAPHVVLTDGQKSILDLCGPNFTVVDFTPSGTLADKFCNTATALKIPITKVHLPNEAHCRKVWERDVVLVRPDWFVAWRSASGETVVENIDTADILLKVVGKA
ncbi:fad binding domain-containing [Trichoderma arundinaceum]|uniref:Fad binding domain-containing n=1 Tax=Trichoderma arundinaceum TaxID=490622 RepID=A0A395NZA7_TRIAR|nr:fad binding domain-containing [Trichoderma arundinaceum]